MKIAFRDGRYYLGPLEGAWAVVRLHITGKPQVPNRKHINPVPKKSKVISKDRNHSSEDNAERHRASCSRPQACSRACCRGAAVSCSEHIV